MHHLSASIVSQLRALSGKADEIEVNIPICALDIIYHLNEIFSNKIFLENQHKDRWS